MNFVRISLKDAAKALAVALALTFVGGTALIDDVAADGKDMHEAGITAEAPADPGFELAKDMHEAGKDSQP